jgi:acyl-[acyl-carrier-protein] desaturase
VSHFSVVSRTRAEARPAFQELSHPVPVTPAEREIGLRSKRYFDSTLKRRTPWLIKNRQVRLLAAVEPGDGERSGRELITADDLEREQISPLLASVLFTFKRIEDKLPDFTGRSYNLFRNYWGINASYHQWGLEESQHSDAIGLILEATGHFTLAELDGDYYDNLQRTWELPFSTPRQMVLYAAFQEQLTYLAYQSLARRADEEGAPLVGQLMLLIARDEAYHGGGYRAFARIFAELDLDGTIEDALHVARNFRMPAQHLMRNRRKDSVDIVRVGAFSKELVSEGTILKVLRGFKFVPEEMALAATAAYWAD